MSRIPARPLFVPVVGIAAALAFAGCTGSAAAPTWTFAPAAAPAVAAAPAAAAPAGGTSAAGTGMADMPGMAAGNVADNATAAGSHPGTTTANLALTIVTGDMTGHTEYPAYIPSDFSLPAYSTVTITVTNFDDATPLAKGTEQYARVSGTDGNFMTVTPIKVGDPNTAAGPARTLSGLDPAAVSHTFTIAALGINIPIPAQSRVTFTIHTGAPGTFYWRCFDPCGDGSTGWGTAMAAMRGFMEGTLTVA